jgi:hypothetical protein
MYQMRLGAIAKKALQNRGALLALAVVLSVLFTTSPVLAVSVNGAPNGMLVSPVLEEISVGKGQILPVQMSVQNPTGSTVTLKAIVNDFIASNNESGQPEIILNNKGPLPLNNFISLVEPIANITLAPQQRSYFNVYIYVPTTAASGGYYGVIRFENANLANTANVGVAASTGTLFLVTVPGNLTEKLKLTQLYVEQNNTPVSLVTSGKLSVVTRLDNVGNIHAQPFGTIEVKSMFGHVVSVIQFNGANPRTNILPDSIRKYVNALPNKHYLGYYQVVASIAWQQGSGNIITASTGFWFIPVWLILTVIGVVVVIALIIWLIVRRRRAQRRKYRH